MKKINFNIKDRKMLYGILTIALVCVFTLTIAYAALNAVLTIQGSAQVSSADWDIHLANPKVTSGSTTTTVPEIKTSSTLEFSTTLNMPGDFYEFTVDIVNSGSIDAMIENVIKNPELTTEQAKYLKYEITYQNGESINTKQLVSKESFVRLKVRVEFRKDIVASDLPITSQTLNLAFTVNYVQSDGSEDIVIIENNGKVIKIASGDLNTVGSEVCIKEECFYVISSTEETVTMLAKMNIILADTPMQSLEAGLTAFAGTTYLKSIAKRYVDNYNTYLIAQGIIPTETRLITYDELESLGCSGENRICSAAPSWVYSTSYWTGSVSSRGVWGVRNDSNFVSAINGLKNTFGIRPVVVISKDYFN